MFSNLFCYTGRGVYATSRTARCATLALLALVLIASLASSASAKQARLFAGSFGAATSIPANPYPLSSIEFVAVDETSHDVYVTDSFNHRIEKFDSTGNLILMLGKDVNKTKVETAAPEAEENLCTAVSGDECQVGQAAPTPGAFESPEFLAVDNSSGPSKGDLYVADKGTTVNEEQTVSINATSGTFTLSFEGQTTAPLPFDATNNEVEAALRALSTIGPGNVSVFGPPGSYRAAFQYKLGGLNLPQMTASSSGLSGGAATAAVATVAQGSSTTRVEKFDPAGQSISGWGEAGQLDGSSITNPPAPVSGPFGAGTFGGIEGIAVDASGDLWITANREMFEFRSDGGFVTGWQPAEANNGIAIDSATNFYYLIGSQIQEFDFAGHEIGSLAPTAAELETEHVGVRGLTVDPSTDDLYLDVIGHHGGSSRIQRYDSSCKPEISEFNDRPGCPPLESFGAGLISEFPGGIAIDSSTHALYVADGDHFISFASLTAPDAVTTKPTNLDHISATLNGTVDPAGIELNPGTEGCRFEWGETTAYGHTAACDKTAAQIGSGTSTVEVSADITGLEIGKTYHYRLVASNHNDVNGFINEPSVGQDLPFGPPLIESTSAIDVAATSATLQTQINPNDLDTHVRIEYGTEAGVYEQATEEIDVGSAGTGQLVTTRLQGLAPATTYHYRVIAENVLGEGGEAVLSGDRLFTTQGTGAVTLPDARRWELVSPPNKLGANLEPIGLGVVQASPSGDAISYAANAPTEPLPPGNANSVQILSSRGSIAWVSRDINTAHDAAVGKSVSTSTGREVGFFSADLSRALVQPMGATLTASLSVEASAQTPFLRTNFSPGHPTEFCLAACYRPLVTGAEGFANVPPGTEFGGEVACPPGSEVCGPRILGASSDASHVVILSGPPLVEGAPGGGLYEWSEGELRLVSVLPSGGVPSANSGVLFGSESSRQDARNAISPDGSRIVWAEGGDTGSKNHLYLRETSREETLQLDLAKSGSGKGTVSPQFQTASADDSRIFFTDEQQLTSDSGASQKKPDLYECEVVEGEGGELECNLTDLSPESSGESGEVLGVPGASDDGSSVYFIAKGALTGTEENEHHEKAQGGKPNLYLRRGGTTSFIAVLSSEDSPDWAKPGPGLDSVTNLASLTARVSPNGRWLAFMSQRPLSGYDNRDGVSAATDQEVFLYDAAPGPGQPALLCASCRPSGARPHGVPFFELSFFTGGLGPVGPISGLEGQTIAASIPGWTPYSENRARYQSRYLSDSGRLFFNSSDALVPRDSNGTGDVYEYEPPGVGDCTTESPSFAASNGGCISLITSGTSKDESAFLDASESGDDVFFLTKSQLTHRDIDTALDVYDASVGGGEEEPIAPPLCEGDGCQLPATPPNDPTPGSLSFHGAGNVKEEAKAKKKHSKKHKKKAHKKQKRAASHKHGGAK